MNTFNGYRVYENPYLTKQKTIEVEKSRWLKLAETILRWNPCNGDLVTPDFRIEYEPSDQVIIKGNNLIAHPAVIKRLRESIRAHSPMNRLGILDFGVSA